MLVVIMVGILMSPNCRMVRVVAGIGEKRSNGGTQWYQQDRIYDSFGLCPALSTFKSDYWIVVYDREEG